jgi:hypothetical protein
MATYDAVFDSTGLRDWCDSAGGGAAPKSMADLLAQAGVKKTTHLFLICRFRHSMN